MKRFLALAALGWLAAAALRGELPRWRVRFAIIAEYPPFQSFPQSVKGMARLERIVEEA